jgi:putative sigma-54 modulation protein
MVANAKMNLQVVFKGMDSSQPLQEYAEKRASKLSKHLHTVTNCHFVFQIEKLDHVVQLHVVAGDFEARAEGRAENMYAAIDEVTDKITHQSRKHKERTTDHSGRPHHGQE